MDLISYCRLRLNRYYEEAPSLLIAIGISTVASAFALGSLLLKREEVDLMSDELSRASQLPSRPVRATALSSAMAELPLFSGADLVQGINDVAQDMAVPFNEASYVLDSSAAIPYKKYRVTLTTTVGYAEIRRFIPALSAELPHLGLDSIRCARPDPTAMALSCELVFSAFYSKAEDE